MPIGTQDFYADAAELLASLNTTFVLLVQDEDRPQGMAVYSNTFSQTELAPFIASIMRLGMTLPPEGPQAPETPGTGA